MQIPNRESDGGPLAGIPRDYMDWLEEACDAVADARVTYVSYVTQTRKRREAIARAKAALAAAESML